MFSKKYNGGLQIFGKFSKKYRANAKMKTKFSLSFENFLFLFRFVQTLDIRQNFCVGIFEDNDIFFLLCQGIFQILYFFYKGLNFLRDFLFQFRIFVIFRVHLRIPPNFFSYSRYNFESQRINKFNKK